MIGAIIGDISGSRYERHHNNTKRFPLFDKKCRLTDDSIMSLAATKAILESDWAYEVISQNADVHMQGLGRIRN